MPISKKLLEKRLLSEKRKELRKVKSKEAARHRRGKEGEVFSELADTLPVPSGLKGSLDKSSIIKLCINYIRLREILQDVWPSISTVQSLPFEHVSSMVNISHGFVIVLSLAPLGDIIYSTDNVKKLLGICQYDMIGAGLGAFIHPSDWSEVEDVIKSASHSLSFTARLKSFVSPKARTGMSKSTAYKTVRFSGQKVTAADMAICGNGLAQGCIVMTGTPVEKTADNGQLLDSMTFTCKHSMNMQLTECDNSFTELTRYPATYAKEKSFYDFIHPGDMKQVEANFKSLYSKEMIQTDPYRLLTFGGGYVRVVTVASVVHDVKSGKAESITSIHHVLGHIEESDAILADVQFIHQASCIKTEALSPVYSEVEGDVEDQVYDDIFNATANCFSTADIMADTESAFEPVKPSDLKMSLNSSGTLVDLGDHCNVADLEAFFDNLGESRCADSDEMFCDLPDLTSDDDMELRAPYISPLDVNDISIVHDWCLSSPTGEKLDDSLPDLSLVNTWDSYRSPDGSPVCSPSQAAAPSPWQSDTVSEQMTPSTNPNSPRADINRRFHNHLTVTGGRSTSISPVSSPFLYPKRRQGLTVKTERLEGADNMCAHQPGGSGYTSPSSFSPNDQHSYIHARRKRKADCFSYNRPLQLDNLDGLTLSGSSSAQHSPDMLAPGEPVTDTTYELDRSSDGDAIDELIAILHQPAKRKNGLVSGELPKKFMKPSDYPHLLNSPPLPFYSRTDRVAASSSNLNMNASVYPAVEPQQMFIGQTGFNECDGEHGRDQNLLEELFQQALS